MYLGAAIKLAIPFAILDRQEMQKAYGGLGAQAQEAQQACRDLRALQGLRPSRYTPSQRETARMALLWGEQYLYGFMHAVKGFDRAEFARSLKQYRQIRAVRMQFFGKTHGEVLSENAVLVDVTDLARHLRKQPLHKPSP